MDGAPPIFTHIREKQTNNQRDFVVIGDDDQEKVFNAGAFIVLWRGVRASGASQTLLLTLIGGSR